MTNGNGTISRMLTILTTFIVIAFPIYYSTLPRPSTPICSTMDWSKIGDEISNKLIKNKAEGLLPLFPEFLHLGKYMIGFEKLFGSKRGTENCPEIYTWIESLEKKTSALPLFPIDPIVIWGYVIALLLVLLNFIIFTYKFGFHFSSPALLQLIPFHYFYFFSSSSILILGVMTSLNLTTLGTYFLVKRQKLSFSEIPKRYFLESYEGTNFLFFTLFAIPLCLASYQNFNEFVLPPTRILIIGDLIGILFSLVFTYLFSPVDFIWKTKKNIYLGFNYPLLTLLSFIFLPVFLIKFPGMTIPNVLRFFVLASTMSYAFTVLTAAALTKKGIKGLFVFRKLSWDNVSEVKEVKVLMFKYLKLRGERTAYLPFDDINKEKFLNYMKENSIAVDWPSFKEKII